MRATARTFACRSSDEGRKVSLDGRPYQPASSVQRSSLRSFGHGQFLGWLLIHARLSIQLPGARRLNLAAGRCLAFWSARSTLLLLFHIALRSQLMTSVRYSKPDESTNRTENKTSTSRSAKSPWAYLLFRPILVWRCSTFEPGPSPGSVVPESSPALSRLTPDAC